MGIDPASASRHVRRRMWATKEVPVAQQGRDIAREKETADHFTGGPGVVATKSQAQGATGGFLIGAVVGAIIGGIVGLIVQGPALWIAPIVFAVGGAVALGVF